MPTESPSALETAAPTLLVRPYEPRDRDAVRAICAGTGFLGAPIDSVFEDRELFADFWTTYYLNHEPDAAWVCELDGRVCGYLLGSRYVRSRPWKQILIQTRLVPLALWRTLTRYRTQSRRYLWWLISRGKSETPYTPKNTAHFHINILAAARSVSGTRRLIDAYLQLLAREGHQGVYGQMVASDERRGPRMFARYGFEVLDKKEVTKYRHLTATSVWLYTVYKDLTANAQLYGLDLHRKKASAA